jgi:hypothetical protein
MADDLDTLFPPDGPPLLLAADGSVVGRQSAEDEATHRALRGFLMLADDLGDSHIPLAMVIGLGAELEAAQGRLTRFQVNVLVALCRGAAKLRGDDTRPGILPIGLSEDDHARLRLLCPTRKPCLADLFAALAAPPMRLSCTEH